MSVLAASAAVSAVGSAAVAPASVERADCPECLMGNLNWLLAQAHYGLATRLAAALAPIGLTPRGQAVLGAAMTGSHTQKALAGIVGLDKTTMVAALDELEAAGFARRVPSTVDRRAHTVEVTDAGATAVCQAATIAQRVQAEVLGALEPDVADALLGTLGTLVRERLSEPAACSGVRRRDPR